MPCTDGGPSWEDIQKEQRNHATIVRLACDRCRELESRGGAVPDWALEWWNEHRTQDLRRQRYEAAAQRDAEIRKQAIAKLTPKERAELGV